jgi:hypothetical protein
MGILFIKKSSTSNSFIILSRIVAYTDPPVISFSNTIMAFAGVSGFTSDMAYRTCERTTAATPDMSSRVAVVMVVVAADVAAVVGSVVEEEFGMGIGINWASISIQMREKSARVIAKTCSNWRRSGW